MNGASFQTEELIGLVAHYPLAEIRFTHDLGNHPLLKLEALAEAAPKLGPENHERRHAQQSPDDTFPKIAAAQLPIAEHIMAMAAHPSWIMLKQIEKLECYRQLIDEIIAPLKWELEKKTGVIRSLTGFIFISTKGAVTPFHFDPEYNLFFQIQGSKKFSTHPAAPPILTDKINEDFHGSGNNMLRWDEKFAAIGTAHQLKPGDGLFVPYKAPHWIEVGDELSISLSITWKSDWCLHQEYGHRFNAWVRRRGHAPSSLPAWPDSAFAKSIATRMLDKIGLT